MAFFSCNTVILKPNKNSNFLFRIDFLSLDVEGAEQAVLEALPWDKIDFQTFLYRGNRVKLGTGSLGDLYEKVDIQ